MDVSDKQADGRGGRQQRIFDLIQKLLFASGLIGLVSLGDNIIEWSRLANYLVTAFHALSEPVAAALSNLLGIQISPLLAEILTLLGILFAAANVDSLRRFGNLVFFSALSMIVHEQILQKQYPRLENAGRVAEILAHVAAWISIVLAVVLLIGGIAAGSFGIGDWRLSGGWSALFLIYVLVGFFVVTRSDDAVPQDEPGRFSSRAFRIHLIVSILFLPGALYRYATFFLFVIIFVLLVAWRSYLLLGAVFLVIVALNEVYFRFAVERDGDMSCILYSVPSTCSAAVPADPQPAQ